MPGATPAGRLAALSEEEVQPLGLTVGERNTLVRVGCDRLPLSQAVRVAAALGGWLEWLAGATKELGEPAVEDVRFDSVALKSAAKRRGLRMDGVRRAAKLEQAAWRALLARKTEPTVGQLLKLAERIGCRPSDLLTTGGI